MNLSVQEINGALLVISQFTLHAAVKKGNRPSYINAASQEIAIPMYEKFLRVLEQVSKLKVLSGEFGADMKVSLLNEGPVTIFIDSKNKEKYDDALVDMRPMVLYNNATVVIVEALVSALSKTAEGNLAFKIIVSHNEQSSVQMDDYFGSTLTTDMQIALKNSDQAFINLPEKIIVESEQTQVVELTKGAAVGNLLVLMPQNKFSTSDLVKDAQSQILKPAYKLP